MASIYDIDPNQLIEKAAIELKKLGFKKPTWSDFVKTGVHKEKPPINPDWWYFRLAAILRSLYKLGPIGTSKLRKKYGGRKNRGHKPDKVYRGSGSIIRKALQQLEESGFVKKEDKGVHKGRILTPKGKSFLDKIASQLYKPQPKVKIPEKIKETKKEKSKPKDKEEKQEIVKEDKKEIVKEQPKELVKEEKKEVIKQPEKEIIEKKPQAPMKKEETLPEKKVEEVKKEVKE